MSEAELQAAVEFYKTQFLELLEQYPALHETPEQIVQAFGFYRQTVISNSSFSKQPHAEELFRRVWDAI